MKLLRYRPQVLIALLALTLTGCAPTVALEPAEMANNPDCAEVIVRLPTELAGLEKRTTNAQSTGAWGEPVAVILRCGLEQVEASTLTCVTAGGMDWLVDESTAPKYRFITFGTDPATEVIIDSEKVSGVTVLEELSGSVGMIPQQKFCTAIDQ